MKEDFDITEYGYDPDGSGNITANIPYDKVELFSKQSFLAGPLVPDNELYNSSYVHDYNGSTTSGDVFHTILSIINGQKIIMVQFGFLKRRPQ